MKKLITITLVMLFTATAWAGDPAAGQQKSQVCAACHGVDGNSPIPMNPRLAGQYADYLEFALTAYRSGARVNPVMQGMSAGLSDEDIADLAAYFSSQQGLDILSREPMQQ
jgi:cytochrome c553